MKVSRVLRCEPARSDLGSRGAELRSLGIRIFERSSVELKAWLSTEDFYVCYSGAILHCVIQ
jgi:hypothetical protein